MPPWADTPAVTRFSLTTPATGLWFAGYNQHRPDPDRIRPASFGLLAHPDPLIPTISTNDHPNPQPSTNPTRRDGHGSTGTTARAASRSCSPPPPPTTPSSTNTSPKDGCGSAPSAMYSPPSSRHPEAKSLAPDGQPVTGDTHGLLQRRPIESAPVLTDLIGKEANQLDERAVLLTGGTPVRTTPSTGTEATAGPELVLPILRNLGPQEFMRRTGRSRSAVYEILSGKVPKYAGPAARYRAVAVDEATSQIRMAGLPLPRNDYAILLRYQQLLASRSQGGEECQGQV